MSCYIDYKNKPQYNTRRRNAAERRREKLKKERLEQKFGKGDVVMYAPLVGKSTYISWETGVFLGYLKSGMALVNAHPNNKNKKCEKHNMVLVRRAR